MESAPSPARCLYGPSQRSTLAERGCTSDARRIRRCSHMRCPSLAAVGLSSLKPHSPAGGRLEGSRVACRLPRGGPACTPLGSVATNPCNCKLTATGLSLRRAPQVEEVRKTLKEVFTMMHQLDSRIADLGQLETTCVTQTQLES